VNERRKETIWQSYSYKLGAQIDSLIRGRWWWFNFHECYESVFQIQMCTCHKHT
jgi:hypothetical protein